ncbi:MAG TPA: hypothetical protein VJR90_02140 [Gammaproteobacteria bacterium]|nr:hypothetical protein [Gammaproteobacteria bacterium]
MKHASVARKPVMRTIFKLTFSLCLLCAGGLCSAPAYAAQACHRPAPQALIAWYNRAHPDRPLQYSPKNSAIYHPISVLRTGRPAVYWMGLAWLSPESGALFAVSCDGKPVGGLPTGAIGKLSTGPVLAELGQSVMFVYVNRETGDCVHDGVRIATLKDNKIIPLWEHGYNQGLNVPASGSTPRRFISETYAVSFGDDGRTLTITGTRAVFTYLKDGSQAQVPDVTAALATETYHWDAGRLRFISDQPYRQSSVCKAD